MGVSRGLWDVLKPVARHESLESLRGKALAIDLSFWVIQLLSRVRRVPLRKPHIHLLFLRSVHLVARIGAFPVFVADGEPPPLKLELRIRRFCRISGVPSNNFLGDLNSNTSQNRNRLFTESIQECMKLLELLGFPVFRAKHEAEGLCAELQRQGLVNACLTPDSDLFLYGAEYIIKKLQADLKEPHVESYAIRDIESILGLYREHLVALALLAGRDYNVRGVPGIGCQNAVHLIKVVPKEQVLQRLHDSGVGGFTINDAANIGIDTEGGALNITESALSKEPLGSSFGPPHCSNCGHPGTIILHINFGCEKCQLEAFTPAVHQIKQGCSPKVPGFKCTCEYCSQKRILRKQSKQEGWRLKVCQRISSSNGLPHKEILRMFMNPERGTFTGDRMPPLVWKSPCVEALEKFLEEHLHWDKTYARQKLLPLLSFYCLKDTVAMRRSSTPTSIAPSIQGSYVPHSIQRIKVLFSKPLYRLRWTTSPTARSQMDWLGLRMPQSNDHDKTDDFVDFAWSELQAEVLKNNLVFTTDEDMMLVYEAYPALVVQFEQERALCKGRKKGTSKKKNFGDLSSNQLQITSFFPARTGACNDACRKAQSVPGSMLCGEKNVDLMQDLGSHKNAAVKLENDADSLADVDFPRTCRMMRITEIGIIHADDMLKDRLGAKQNFSQICPGRLDVQANDLTSLAPNTLDWRPEKQVKIEDLERPNNMWINHFDRVPPYPCILNGLDNDFPRSQKSRECSEACLKSASPHMMLDSIPPSSSWMDCCMVDRTNSSELLKQRSPKIAARAKQNFSQICPGGLDVQANDLTSLAQNTFDWRREKRVKTDNLEMPNNMWINHFDRVPSYPCTLNGLDNDFSRSQKSREWFESCLKSASPHMMLDSTPPFSSWTDSCMVDRTKSSELLKHRSPKIAARRVLFS